MQGKTRITVVAGIYPPHIGGPALYAYNLFESLKKSGDNPSLVKFNKDGGILRHIKCFFEIFVKSFNKDTIVAFDTGSVGVPAALVSVILRKRFVVRVGGDFLWESYLNKKKIGIPLSKFYAYLKEQKLDYKTALIFFLIKMVMNLADIVAFNSSWQANIWKEAYHIRENKIKILPNYFEKKEVVKNINNNSKVFVASSRPIFIKNQDFAKKVFDGLIIKGFDVALETRTFSHEALIEIIKNSYATAVLSISDISPNLVLDGLAYGKPFLLTNESGFSEEYKKCGILVDVSNEEDVRRGIIKLLNEKTYFDLQQNIEDIPDRPWNAVIEDLISFCKI